MELTKVAGNAFIELAKNGKSMSLTMNQLRAYSSAVAETTKKKVNVGNIDIINLKLNYFGLFTLSEDELVLSSAPGVTENEYEELYRNGISMAEYLAFTSPKALNALGISTIDRQSRTK